MGLCGRAEGVFDADVELARSYLEPASAARAQGFRLFDFRKPKDFSEEAARFRFTAFGSGDLDVVDVRDSHVRTMACSDELAACWKDTA